MYIDFRTIVFSTIKLISLMAEESVKFAYTNQEVIFTSWLWHWINTLTFSLIFKFWDIDALLMGKAYWILLREMFQTQNSISNGSHEFFAEKISNTDHAKLPIYRSCRMPIINTSCLMCRFGNVGYGLEGVYYYIMYVPRLKWLVKDINLTYLTNASISQLFLVSTEHRTCAVLQVRV